MPQVLSIRDRVSNMPPTPTGSQKMRLLPTNIAVADKLIVIVRLKNTERADNTALNLSTVVAARSLNVSIAAVDIKSVHGLGVNSSDGNFSYGSAKSCCKRTPNMALHLPTVLR